MSLRYLPYMTDQQLNAMPLDSLDNMLYNTGIDTTFLDWSKPVFIAEYKKHMQNGRLSPRRPSRTSSPRRSAKYT